MLLVSSQVFYAVYAVQGCPSGCSRASCSRKRRGTSGWASTCLLAGPGPPSTTSPGPAACPVALAQQLPSPGLSGSPAMPIRRLRPAWRAATVTWTLMSLCCRSCQRRASTQPLRACLLLPRQLPQVNPVVSGNGRCLLFASGLLSVHVHLYNLLVQGHSLCVSLAHCLGYYVVYLQPAFLHSPGGSQELHILLYVLS